MSIADDDVRQEPQLISILSTHPSILTWRIDDLPHLAEIEPNQIALDAVVDDHVTRAGMSVGLEAPGTSRARHAPFARLPFRP